jgi:hypothetical protein
MTAVERDGTPGPESLHRWWSPRFRSDLYADLDPILGVPASTRDEDWDANTVLEAAGLGLISPIRDHIGFGVDLLALISGGVDDVELIIDGRDGLRYAEVFSLVGKLVPDTSMRLTLLRTDREGEASSVRIPVRAVDATIRSMARIMRAGRSMRAPHASDGHPPGANAVFFETTDKGRQFSDPIATELLDRGVSLVRASPSGCTVLTPQGSSHRLRRVAFGISSVNLTAVEDQIITTLGSTRGALIETDLQRRLVSTLVARRSMDYLPGIRGAVASARTAVERLDARVTMQEGIASPAARAFILEARRLGARTFTTPHGMVDDSAPERAYMVDPDVILDWGSYGPSFSDTTTVRIVGSAFTEERIQQVLAMRKAASRSASTVAVAFGRPGRIVDPMFFASAIRMVARTSQAMKDVEFEVKIHPGDSRSFWEAALRPLEGRHRLTFSGRSIEEVIAMADVLITTHSTAGAEAILAEVPVLCIGGHVDPDSGRPYETHYEPPYLTVGAARLVQSDNQLSDGIKSILLDGVDGSMQTAMTAFGDRFLDRSSDGTSVERSADAIIEALDERG